MPKVNISDLTDVSETLLVPLYFRAVESQRPDAIVRDDKAAEIISQIDYDFSWLRGLSSDKTMTLVRARYFDRCARAFLSTSQDGIVVDIGCGLDARFFRVDNGSVEWYDLDLPQVIALRNKLIGEAPRCHFLAGSAFDLSWMNALAAKSGRPFLFLAEGFFPYFSEKEVKGLVLALRERFPESELVFDAMSPFQLWFHSFHPILRKTGARLRWALKGSRNLESWGLGIRLLDEWFYFDEPEPRLGWFRLLRFFPLLGKSARVVRYRLGERQDRATQ